MSLSTKLPPLKLPASAAMAAPAAGHVRRRTAKAAAPAAVNTAAAEGIGVLGTWYPPGDHPFVNQPLIFMGQIQKTVVAVGPGTHIPLSRFSRA